MNSQVVIRSVVLVAGCAWFVATAGSLSNDQQRCLDKAVKLERKGWIYVRLQGEARDLGFQHGYLLAREIADGLRSTGAAWERSSGMEWSWLVARGSAMFRPHIDAENYAELEGIADGMRAAAQMTTVEELIAYNGIIELSGYWWPTELKAIKDAPAPPVRESCSAFIATGHMTRDGNVVLGHNTMMGYNEAFPNVIAEIVPTRGHRILWQTSPGWIHSGTDFFVTDAGLVGAETTIGGFEGFSTNGVPEFVRMRRATQDAGNIDEWCGIMGRGNNGGYANAWLLGDINTREIARLEQGLKHTALEKKRDGYFAGSNVAEDLKILRLETSVNETDIRSSGVARRVRWQQLMREYAGRIDARIAKEFEADHFDTYEKKTRPGGRTLCGHFELDKEPAGHWPGVPYGCAGTVDAKVVDATLARNMAFACRWGSACGRAFEADHYLEEHPQFDWMAGVLKNRPAQPWTEFRADEKRPE